MQYPIERATWLMKAQQMHNVARRLMHVPRTAPVAYIVERDLLQHVEDDLLVNAIRNGKLVRIWWNELTPEEQRAAYRNCFQPNTYD